MRRLLADEEEAGLTRNRDAFSDLKSRICSRDAGEEAWGKSWALSSGITSSACIALTSPMPFAAAGIVKVVSLLVHVHRERVPRRCRREGFILSKWRGMSRFLR